MCSTVHVSPPHQHVTTHNNLNHDDGVESQKYNYSANQQRRRKCVVPQCKKNQSQPKEDNTQKELKELNFIFGEVPKDCSPIYCFTRCSSLHAKL